MHAVFNNISVNFVLAVLVQEIRPFHFPGIESQVSRIGLQLERYKFIERDILPPAQYVAQINDLF